MVLEVRDDGPGVAPELRERIFEPFVTTRSNGSGGLGLAIAQRIVREAGFTPVERDTLYNAVGQQATAPVG